MVQILRLDRHFFLYGNKKIGYQSLKLSILKQGLQQWYQWRGIILTLILSLGLEEACLSCLKDATISEDFLIENGSNCSLPADKFTIVWDTIARWHCFTK